jgi:predicted Rossmann fold nucleotide-binding protein DprA/Smf involved in DNA uptake
LTGPEQGFLLLTSSLGDPDRKPLSVAQFRALAKRVLAAEREISSRDLQIDDLVKLGYDPVMAERIFGLLSGTNQLREYLRRSEACDCYPITRLNPIYPEPVRRRLRVDSPGVLWAKGDVTLIGRPAVAVIGSRELNETNRAFAEEAGRQIAKQGYVLVSGNARGADRIAQRASLEAGGQVISVVADSLQKQPLIRNVLWISLDDFDQAFSAQRALHRNHVIHTMGSLTIAAQCTLEKGGTWNGILANLKYGWNPVCMFDDQSDAAKELENRGVQIIGMNQLQDLAALSAIPGNFIDA